MSGTISAAAQAPRMTAAGVPEGVLNFGWSRTGGSAFADGGGVNRPAAHAKPFLGGWDWTRSGFEDPTDTDQ